MEIGFYRLTLLSISYCWCSTWLFYQNCWTGFQSFLFTGVKFVEKIRRASLLVSNIDLYISTDTQILREFPSQNIFFSTHYRIKMISPIQLLVPFSKDTPVQAAVKKSKILVILQGRLLEVFAWWNAFGELRSGTMVPTAIARCHQMRWFPFAQRPCLNSSSHVLEVPW